MKKSKPKKSAPAPRASEPKRQIGTVEESLARLKTAVESVAEIAAAVEKTLAPVLPGPQSPIQAREASFGETACPHSRELSLLADSIEDRVAAIRDTLARVQF